MNMFKTNAVSALMQGLIDKVVSPHWSEKAKAKNYPKMETASQEDIDLHNSEVNTRQVKRAKARNDIKMGK